MKKWVGIDLDGTLAKSTKDGSIGRLIPEIAGLILGLVNNKVDVRIFTVRAKTPDQIAKVRRWMRTNGLPDLPVTNIKDDGMEILLDDRAVRVQRDLGELCPGCAEHALSWLNRRTEVHASARFTDC
jgi:hypothetical protein